MKTGNPTAAQTAAALRTLVTSRYEGNFGSLTRALLGDDQTHYRAVNAQIWRAHSKKKPGHLSPDLATKILTLFPRSKGDKEKKALAVIRAASKLPPQEKKVSARKRTTKTRSQRIRTTRRVATAPVGVQANISGLHIDILSGAEPLGGFVSVYNPKTKRFEGDVLVQMDEENVIFSVQIPKAKAMSLFLS